MCYSCTKEPSGPHPAGRGAQWRQCSLRALGNPLPRPHRPPPPRSSEPRQAPRGIQAPAPARCWAPKGAPPPTPLAGTLALTWGACACAPAPLPRAPRYPHLLPPTPYMRRVLVPQDSVRASNTSFININSKKIFSVLFTICFFPWLKIIGDEPPAARVPRIVSEGTMGTDNDCIFSPSKTSSNKLPSPGCRSCTKSSGSHILAFLIICLFRASCILGPESLLRGGGGGALFDFYQPSSLIFFCPNNIWCI